MSKKLAPAPLPDEQISKLVEHITEQRPTSITILKGGAWSSASSVTTYSGEFILRTAATPEDFQRDHFVARYSSSDLPIPAVLGIGQVSEQQWWCLSEQMPGVHLDELSSEEMGRTLPYLARTLRAMRSVDSSANSGYGSINKNGDGIYKSFADQLMDVANDQTEGRIGGWSTFLKNHAYERGVFNAGLERMKNLLEIIPDVRQLIHMDTINYNVVVQNNRISGVFDWGCAMWGDALYDLAWFQFWNPWYPQWSNLNIPAYLHREVGVLGDHAQERMRCYLLHIGIEHIRYNAFLRDAKGMNDIAIATEKLL